MRTKMRCLVIVLFVGVLLVGTILLQGCQESNKNSFEMSTVEPIQTPTTMVQYEQENKNEQIIMQTTCPIMDMAIDKNIYTEYKGRKVYFCCSNCINTFNENPEKYLSKLPQFNR